MFSIKTYLVLGLITALLAACLYISIRTYILIKKSSELIRASRPYERVLDDPSRVIVFAGDSTAVGTGSTDPALSVAGRFGTLFPDASIRNYGVNGLRLEGLSRTLTLEKTGRADLLILQIGANDVIRFTSFAKISESLDNLLKEAFLISPQVVLLHGGNVGLAPFFPRPLGAIWSNRSARMREVYIEKASTAGAVYIDLYSSRKDDIFLKDIPRYYAPDLLHPTGEGYGLWFEKIIEGLKARYSGF